MSFDPVTLEVCWNRLIGVVNELFTIPGGGHGNFKPDERSRAYVKIREFLSKNGL